MLRTLLKIGLLLVVGILVYNYFLGNPSEKASSQKIFNEVKDLGAATWDLLKTEKEKFDNGKYDDALEKMGKVFDDLRGMARDLGNDVSEKVEDLDQRRKEIGEELRQAQESGSEISQAEKERLKREWEELMQETEDLMKEMEKN